MQRATSEAFGHEDLCLDGLRLCVALKPTQQSRHRLQRDTGLQRLAGEGVAVLMISSELPEVLGMSDRIMVMHEGRVSGFLDRAEADQVKIMQLAAK